METITDLNERKRKWKTADLERKADGTEDDGIRNKPEKTQHRRSHRQKRRVGKMNPDLANVPK